MHGPVKWAAVVSAAGLLAGLGVWAVARGSIEEARPSLGLFTSLPIYWPESDSLSETLEGNARPHWARTALEADNKLVPLDTLDGEELAQLDRLVMAQPRPLAPGENVALDEWVRGGGRVLLFADPMLTEHSRFMLGDKRRPQDVVVLSPILRRWGLELAFDEDQGDEERTVRFGDGSIPVRLPGSFRKVAPGASAACVLEADSVIARCAIGKGRAVVIADAAVLGGERDVATATRELAQLTSEAFSN